MEAAVGVGSQLHAVHHFVIGIIKHRLKIMIGHRRERIAPVLPDHRRKTDFLARLIYRTVSKDFCKSIGFLFIIIFIAKPHAGGTDIAILFCRKFQPPVSRRNLTISISIRNRRFHKARFIV